MHETQPGITGAWPFEDSRESLGSRAALVTTDEPVVVIGGPGCSRVVSAGLDDAAVVVFPLGPSQVLAMFKPGRLPGRAREDLTASETHELNTELIAASSRFAFEQPSRAVARRLPVPRGPAGRVLRDELAVRGNELRQVVAFHVETRWAGASKPPTVARQPLVPILSSVPGADDGPGP